MRCSADLGAMLAHPQMNGNEAILLIAKNDRDMLLASRVNGGEFVLLVLHELKELDLGDRLFGCFDFSDANLLRTVRNETKNDTIRIYVQEPFMPYNRAMRLLETLGSPTRITELRSGPEGSTLHTRDVAGY